MKALARMALFGAALFGAATILHAQSNTLPDCRQPNLVAGEQCVYHNTQLPVQKYLGDISLSQDGQVHMVHLTGPVGLMDPHGASAIAPSVTGSRSFNIGVLGSIQTETLGYKSHVSGGFKLFATKQWSDWRGVAVEGTMIRYDLGQVGTYSGDNHTEAIAAGPRIEHSFGPVTPYGEALLGALYQYAPGMTESGVVGADVWLGRHLSLVPAEAEYRYASLQDSSVTSNPRRGRIELESGLVFHFGIGRGKE